MSDQLHKHPTNTIYSGISFTMSIFHRVTFGKQAATRLGQAD